MALRIRRGTEAQRTTIVPENGELLYVTDHVQNGASPLWIGDGQTAGGYSASGVAPGVVNSLARYTGTSANVVPTENITWDDTANAFKVSSGTVTITAGNGPRSLLNLSTFSNVTKGNSMILSRGRGSELFPLALQALDNISTIGFSAYDGTASTLRASISATVGSAVIALGAPIAATFSGKTGVGPFSIILSIPTQGSAPSINKQYIVSGNGNSLYNGTFVATASTTSSITLYYTVDPGVFGAGITEIKLAPIVSAGMTFSATTTNGNSIKAIKVYQNGSVVIGPNFDEDGLLVDPAWNGQLSVISNVTASTNVSSIATMSLKSYFDGSTGQYLAMQRFRGTPSNPTVVQTNDQIFNLNFSGFDGIGTIRSSNIRAYVDGTVATGRIPGGILFTTATATGVQSLALRLTSTQSVEVGGTIYSNAVPATFWNYDSSGATLALTTNQVVTFANFSGSVLVNCYNSGTVTQYLCGGGGAPLVAGSSKVTATGTMQAISGGYTFTASETGDHSFYVIRTRSGA